MKIIAVMGEPGTGKSTLVRKFLEKLSANGVVEEHFDKYPLVPYHWSREHNVYILGKYQEGVLFSGTDTMSMAVQPKAIEFLDELSKEPFEATVIFEGDRLCNQSFLEHCMNHYDVLLINLKVDIGTREERFKERGTNQNEQFLRSRETKLKNLRGNFSLQEVTKTLKNYNLEDLETNSSFILDSIYKKPEVA